MKEFRIAKCISEDGKGVGKHVIFKDGSRRKPILEDQEGREYIEIDNWINGDPDLLEFNYYPSMVKRMSLSFNNRVSDMLESIKKGYGDVIVVNDSLLPFFNLRSERVLYFLDRKYGEDLRQQTLEDWEHTVFKYVLCYNSIYVDTSSKRAYSSKTSDIFFNSVEEAKNIVDRIIGDALEKCAYFVGKICPDADDDNNEIMKHIDRCIISDLISDQVAMDILYLKEGQPIFLDPNKSSREYIHRLFKIKQDVVPL